MALDSVEEIIAYLNDCKKAYKEEADKNKDLCNDKKCPRRTVYRNLCYQYIHRYNTVEEVLAEIEGRNPVVYGFSLPPIIDLPKVLKEYEESQKNIEKLATVICNGIGIGVSAESILAFCTGVENKSMYPPSDADDFKRCHNLLSAFPEWKDKLKDIGKTHKAWGTVGEHWSEIEEAYLKEDYKAVHNMLDKYRQEEA